MKSLTRSLDAKGRLMLPPEYREVLHAGEPADAFWLTCFYGRLVAYLPADWEGVIEQLSRIPIPSPRLSHFKTKIMGLAQELIPDVQGRVRIPQSLMREAGLHKDVMLVGMVNTFEIWDQQRFDELRIEDVSEELAASGLAISL
jgi:MraZ protein